MWIVRVCARVCVYECVSVRKFVLCMFNCLHVFCVFCVCVYAQGRRCLYVLCMSVCLSPFH